MRLGTAVAPSYSQMRLGTAIAPSYNQMRLGTAVVPGTARLSTAFSGESTNRPMTSNKVYIPSLQLEADKASGTKQPK